MSLYMYSSCQFILTLSWIGDFVNPLLHGICHDPGSGIKLPELVQRDWKQPQCYVVRVRLGQVHVDVNVAAFGHRAIDLSESHLQPCSCEWRACDSIREIFSVNTCPVTIYEKILRQHVRTLMVEKKRTTKEPSCLQPILYSFGISIIYKPTSM